MFLKRAASVAIAMSVGMSNSVLGSTMHRMLWHCDSCGYIWIRVTPWHRPELVLRDTTSDQKKGPMLSVLNLFQLLSEGLS